MRSRNPPWSDLPSELLSAIANFLTSNPIDILTFRSICRSWRSSLQNPISSSILSPQLPLKILSPPSSLCSDYRDRFNSLLSITSIFALHPSSIVENGDSSSSPLMPNTWVLFLDEYYPGKVCICQPFSNSSYLLPLDFSRKLNLLGFHAVFLGRFYNLSSLHDYGLIIRTANWSGNVLKVVLFDESFVVVLFKNGKLGLWRLGVQSGDAQWEVVHDGKGFRFDDIVEFKGRVLGVDRRGRLYEINCGDLTMNPVCHPIARGGGRRKRLVESFGVLNLVVRCSSGETVDKNAVFKVYEFSEQSKKWHEITSIRDRIFMFGCEFSFCLSDVAFGGLFRKNSIIFKSESFRNYRGPCEDSFLYNGDHNLSLGIWHLGAPRIEGIMSFPGYSNVFWPPPAWLWPDDKSKRLGLLEAAFDRLLKGSVDETLMVQLKELSSLAEFVASCRSISKQNLVNIFKQPQMTGKFLKDVDQEIEKEVKVTQKDIQDEAMIRPGIQRAQKSAERATSNLNDKGCADSQNSTSDDAGGWLTREWRRRLATHEEVKAVLGALSKIIKDYPSEIEDFIKLQEQSCASVVNETGSPTQEQIVDRI